MSPEEYNLLAAEQQSFVFDRMFKAVEKVRERLDRSCKALADAEVSYAVIGGHAVAAWVATIDDGAVRNTQDVDLLIREVDLGTATEALQAVGFKRDEDMGVVVFLDGDDGKPSQGIHILLAGQKVKDSYISATPLPEQAIEIDSKRIIDLVELVRMKLNSYRDKDRTHLRDMIQVGLIDKSWPEKFERELGYRLQELLNDPDG